MTLEVLNSDPGEVDLAGWSGPDEILGETCLVAMDRDKTVIARFTVP